MYLTDLFREIIIIILLIFLIYKTKILLLRGIFSFVLLIHLYKLIVYFNEYYKNTKKYFYIYLLLFIILSFSLYLLIFKDKQIYFIICFLLFRIITSKLSDYKELPHLISNNINLLISIISFIFYYVYNKYKYKNILLIDSINHLLLFIGL